jgi:hypothetical protein
MNIVNMLAQMPGGDDIIALVLGALVFMIPIIAILTQHQQKMARLMREGQPQNPLESEAIRREIETLRQLVVQQTIAIDNLAAQQRQLAGQVQTPPPIESRLTQES